MILRALTYRPIARGDCQFCHRPSILRFAYNPYGDDFLCCEECGNLSDEQFAEHENRG